MSDRSLARAAARNNAEWCDAFSRTHGIAGRFQAAFWSSPVRTPPYYPDAVTLRPNIGVEHLLSGIDAGEGCSVKDSFACLDLGAAAFRPLFRAEWVARQPVKGRRAATREWSALTTETQLRGWEATWGEVPGGSGFFRPALLEDETIAVLAGYESDRIVAGPSRTEVPPWSDSATSSTPPATSTPHGQPAPQSPQRCGATCRRSATTLSCPTYRGERPPARVVRSDA